ncbi:hypothetical protein GCM10010264_72370 [Streptomyces globisporus]|uniref:hypothetical protein n=1 Tax=Streptomyces globisporus TaxID=1908 RepID=UPI001998C0C7|nr:hypothetical protein GCM10010264_72370 [Streptomyces globisporus]
MSGATAARGRLARSYTAARRHPWVLGKLGDWVIWFGPYSPAQLVVIGGGAVLLINTFAWWSWLGPVPVVLWLVAAWAVRGAKIGGVSPSTAVLGLVQLLSQPQSGRIAGRAARDVRPRLLTGSFVIEPPRAVAAPAPAPAPAVSGRVASVRHSGPASGLSQLLGGAGLPVVPSSVGGS